MNFNVPEEGDLFETVEYAELGKEEAAKIIEEYRNDAKKRGPPPEKRFRGNYHFYLKSCVRFNSWRLQEIFFPRTFS